jgi:hypothetical protein
LTYFTPIFTLPVKYPLKDNIISRIVQSTTTSETLQIPWVDRKLQTFAPNRAEAPRLRFFTGLQVEAIATIMAKIEACRRARTVPDRRLAAGNFYGRFIVTRTALREALLHAAAQTNPDPSFIQEFGKAARG